MSERLKVLVVGGTGTFGSRLVQLLKDDSRLTLIVCGRSAAKAEALVARSSPAPAELLAAQFDRDGNPEAEIAALKPDLLVDASGPFQAYGPKPYKLVEACIRLRVNYLDLADGADFVSGVGAFDAQARAGGVYVLSGVSSFPVLTAAAVRRLAEGLSAVSAIRGGIAPSPYAGVGENVIRAIASYAGQKVQRKRNGRMQPGHPFTETLRYTIAPPGQLPLGRRLFSLVDVPDLRALAELWPEAKDVWMGAGPVPAVLHCMLVGLAWLVRWRILPSLSPLSPLMYFVSNRFRWGEHRGGMFVEVQGHDEANAATTRSWHLLAEGEDGPLIPSMAAEGVIRRMLDGQAPAIGARPATNELELADYDRLFASRAISTGVREERRMACAMPYQRVLSGAFDMLPAAIRNMHAVGGVLIAEGEASVERGRNPVARLAAFIMRFPAAAAKVPVSVRFEDLGESERWIRSFGNHQFESLVYAGKGKFQHLLCERFGPLVFGMALMPEGKRLRLSLLRWTMLGVPLPIRLAPRSEAFEAEEDGRFHFDVRISHPLTGLIVHYRGWLIPVQKGEGGAEPLNSAPVPRKVRFHQLQGSDASDFAAARLNPA